MSTQEISQLIGAVNNLTQTVSDKNKEIDARVEQATEELDAWKENLTPNDINAEGRYVTELYIKGDKDTFYPVIFSMPSNTETEITIFRHYSWNNYSNSDFNTSHVAGALVALRGQSHPWSGNANYLRTVVNFQRYRQTVANVGFLAYCNAAKSDPAGNDTVYNRPTEGYLARVHSGFMLRGGRLKYLIVSNHKIDFKVLADGEEFYNHKESHTNVKFLGKTLTLPNDAIQTGDSSNNHSTTYVSYGIPTQATEVS
ncbi:hypothetical protein [Vibrio sp. AND4]|uniref:hypothetical protein n=1 Tax=Vibrio sp. AND4 TaxID=314289 RepID=UPI00015F1CB4|nr:hypothetical protein [Vibrio sp. AND4]EDP57015.1 hypothetical protein AND4_04138 [Vibrio sp. AND4]